MDLLDDLKAQLGVYFNYDEPVEVIQDTAAELLSDVLDAYQYVGR